jgi:hypothetical protein
MESNISKHQPGKSALLRLNPGKGKDKRKKGNSQNFPKLWAFSHLGAMTCRYSIVTECMFPKTARKSSKFCEHGHRPETRF